MNIPIPQVRRAEPISATELVTTFERIDENRFAGYALDPADPGRRFAIDLVLDGEPVALLRAERFDRRLLQLGSVDGCHGFQFQADAALLTGQRLLQARLANTGTPIGRPVDLHRTAISKRAGTVRTGSVSWNAGLRLFGEARLREGGAPLIRVRDGLRVVTEIRPTRTAPARNAGQGDPAFAHGGTGRGGLAADDCPFSLHLPESYADGRVHRLRVEDETGLELEGSPVAILAFPEGLARALPEAPGAGDALRAEWFDRLCPGSLPFERYPDWLAGTDPGDADATGSVRVVLVGADGLAETQADLEHQTLGRWSAACVEADGGRFAPSDLTEAATGDLGEEDVVVLVRTGTRLADDALAALAGALRAAPECMVAYADAEMEREGRVVPVFFGAFDYERQLEQGYAAGLFAVRIDAIRASLALRPDSLERLFLALLETQGGRQGDRLGHVERAADRILHRPGVLARLPAPTPADAERLCAATRAHLAARGVPAEVIAGQGSGFAAARVRREAEDALVSIVIPTRDRADLLESCIASIRAHTRPGSYEIVVVDNDSADPTTRLLFERLELEGVRIVPCAGPFNYARLNNAGVAAAAGAHVLLLNNDVEIRAAGWLPELVSRLAPDVGAVGAVLRWPNGIVQHGGIVLGPGFSAADAFNDCAAEDPGYGDLLRVAREASAATAACLLVRREEYRTLGGFDDTTFPVLFNDVDFCLKLRARGRRVVVTPHLDVVHHESASRGRDEAPSRRGCYRRELAALRRRWGAALAADPAYSPFLNLDPYPFSALAATPRRAEARTRRLPVDA